MARTVILGAGLAGLTVARELRTLRPDHPITVVTRCDGHAYPKPQLSTSLRLGKQPDDLIQTRVDDIRALGIDVLCRRHVTVIDPVRHEVQLDGGLVIGYDDLVLALGASPFVPPMNGDGAAAVLTVNHLDDLRRLYAQLAPDQPVLLVGGGLIGMEFCADMLSKGLTVHVVDPGAGPLPRLLPPRAAAGMTAALERAGAVFHWGCTVRELNGRPGAFEATLSDGTHLAVGTVLSAVGLRPNVELARSAGLPVGRGILVDRQLLASPHHYAIGDCAELPGGVYVPFIKPIGEQARHVARAIAGLGTEPFQMANYAVAVKVPQWPAMSTTPLPDEAGRWHEVVDALGALCELTAEDGRLLRVVATGNRAGELRGHLARVPNLLGLPEAASLV